MEMSLGELDPELALAMDAERDRQRSTLEMIASENFVPEPCSRRTARC
jgi:glycine hydroxymethyltransferase